MIKKLLISILTGLIFLFSFTPSLQVLAQTTSTPPTSGTTWYNQTLPDWYLKVYDETNPNEIFGERYTAAQVQWVIYSIPSLLINLVTNGNSKLGACLVGVMGPNVDINLCVQGIEDAIKNLKSEFDKLKPIGSPEEVPSIASQILSDRPISGISYIRNIVKKLTLVPEVHAQQQTTGPGFSVLSPLAFLWRASRNIAFAFFVLIAIVFAFMIMFRVKINPQTVITIQSALPKVVITLILVTFSFAIAGFMIDLIYVIMAVFSALLASVLPIYSLAPGLGAKSIFYFINGTPPILHDSGLSIFLYFLSYIILFLITVIFAFIASLSGLHISSILFSIVLLIFVVILILILLWYLLKTIFVLFKNLAAVYGLIIIAPLQITAGALFPQMGFGQWLKQLFSKLIVFPLTGIFIFLSIVFLYISMYFSVYGIVANNLLINTIGDVVDFMNLFGLNLSTPQLAIATGLNGVGVIPSSSLWGPPMLGNPASATAIAFLLMSVGLIMMVPKISEMIEGFMAGKGFAGTAIGEALGPLNRPLQGIAGIGTEYGTYASQNWLLNRQVVKNLEDWLRSHGGGVGKAGADMLSAQRAASGKKINP
jgi:hypothetical protein